MIEDEIKKRLLFLNATKLVLTNDSEQHKHHAGNTGGGHFHLLIISNQFKNRTRMERHRLIYDALSDLMPESIHALSIKTLSPEER
ncbi:MAG: BolA family protein [Methylophilaceae bacterium]